MMALLSNDFNCNATLEMIWAAFILEGYQGVNYLLISLHQIIGDHRS